MITTRYIDVAFGGARSAMARALYQYDYGQILRITDLTLPFAYEVHFADTKTGNSVTMIGNADGVEIPDACLLTSGNVYCWFYLHDTESDGETRYEVLIPILARAKPTNAAPTPVQQDVIDQAIAALDAAVQQTGEDVIAAGASASAAAGSASDAEAWAVGERDGEPVESTDPTYHNNSKYYAGEAASAAQTASQDAQTATNAATAAGNAKTAAETAQGKAEAAQEKAEAAQTAAEDAADQTALDVIAAADSADEASGYANTASGYASTASGYAIAAQGHANDASGYALSASGYATNAYNSAQAAAGSAGEASGYATTASGYASAANDAKISAQGAQTAAETAQGLAEAAQTGAEAAQTAAESARDAAVAATEDKAPVILDSASGAIVSIVDGAQGMNARSLVVGMEPIQDLHGYENPWPAGGGKNLLNSGVSSQTINQLVITANGDGTFSVNGTASAATNIVIASFVPDLTATYTLSGIAGDSDAYLEVAGYTATRTISGNSRTFAGSIFADTDPKSVRLHIVSGKVFSNVVIKPQLELGSTATTYAPYSNICPISGRTGVTAFRTGKNLWDVNAITPYSSIAISVTKTGDGYQIGIDSVSNKTVLAVYGVLPAGTYSIAMSIKDENGQTVSAYLTKDGATYINIASGWTSFAADGVAEYGFLFFWNAGSGVNTVSNIMLNVGSTALPYEPYVGTTFPVTWQTEAGTVYGGTVDVVSGLLTVTHKIVDMGNLSWSYNSSPSPFFYAGVSDIKRPESWAAIPDWLCSMYKTISGNNVSGGVMGVGGNPANSQVRVCDTAYTDKDTFTTAVTGQKIVYELATPHTYQLDPQTVSMLLGKNNVWSTGDSVSLTYPCDTKLYIEKLTAPTEDDMVANANIPIHTFFMIGNSLYYSTAAIAQGAAIVIGTNCAMVSLAEALNQLNS